METGNSNAREEKNTNNRFKPPLWNHVDVLDKGGQGGGNVKWRCKYYFSLTSMKGHKKK